MSTAATIPARSVFRAQEVCEIAEVQPYVLRGWEAEFPELGVSKTPGGPRVYRRADVELVLRLKQLVFEEGLTLAGVRRQLREELPELGAAGVGMPSAEGTGDGELTDVDVAEVLGRDAKRRLRDVRDGLEWILSVLGGQARPRPSRTSARHARPGRASRRSAPKKVRRAARPSKKVKSRSKASRPARGRKKR